MPDTAAAVESAEIDSALYRAWLAAKADVVRSRATLKEIEAAFGSAELITVDGRPVIRLIVREVENASWTSRYYRRLGDREGDDE